MTGQGEGGAVLGEEARAALLLAMERVIEREDNPPPGRLAYAAEIVLDQFIRALVAQARADGAAETARGALELFAVFDAADNERSAASRLLHVREYLVREAGS